MNQAALNTVHFEPNYPFAAIVGQKRLKLALILAAMDLGLGGVLLRGEKGTAKSTAARALAGLLPDTPFVDMPLGATEDRVAGSLDMAAAVRQGRVRFRPGLLARAHHGILYVDEVNLLPPHLAHLILDAAASGLARVEREGVSRTHPARFALVASCNPEEGPLGPQLLDRFGLCVEVVGEKDPALRLEVIKRRLAYEADPAAFAAQWAAQEDKLRQGLASARTRLQEVAAGRTAQAEAARLAAMAGSRGQRGELALIRAARALAAWQGKKQADAELVREVAPLALAHRAAPPGEAPIELQNRLRPQTSNQKQPETPKPVRPQDLVDNETSGQRPGDERALFILAPGPVRPVLTRLPAKEGASRGQAGRRAAREVPDGRGRYLRASPQILGRPLALDATFRAAAPHQTTRRIPGGPALVVRKPDLREKVKSARRGRLLLFLVDASGSMKAAARMRTTKAAVLGLLTEAYIKRDRVGLAAFGGTAAKELLPPTSSVEVARRLLAELPTGGKTPLASGLVTLAEILKREMAKDAGLTPLVVILTDGRPNVPLNAKNSGQRAGDKGGGWGDGWGDGGYADREVLNLAQRLALDPRPRFVVVDTDTGSPQEINLCRPLAQYLGADCVSLGKLTKELVLDLVRKHW